MTRDDRILQIAIAVCLVSAVGQILLLAYLAIFYAARGAP